MSVPKHAYTPRPVQVQWIYGHSSLVEYVPANIEKPRFEKAVERRDKARAKSDRTQMRVATIDLLGELLTGWSFRDKEGNPTKPTRAALGRMPDGWLDATSTAIGKDAAEFQEEYPD